MSWKDEIKKEDNVPAYLVFDWDKEYKNILDKLRELAVKYNFLNSSSGSEHIMQSLMFSLHELKNFYESNKEKLQ